SASRIRRPPRSPLSPYTTLFRSTKVNIRVPFQLLRAGVRLASLIPNGAKDQINEALRKNGVPIDVTQLKPEDLDELVVHLADLRSEEHTSELQSRSDLVCRLLLE